MLLFKIFVGLHICTGATGAIAFWVPVIGRKGGANHVKWGRVFTYAIMLTGFWAICMSTMTILWPLQTHPHLVGRFEGSWIRGIFGWLMLHMGILTINLAWYGWLCVLNKRDHAKNREWRNLALQAAILIAAVNLAIQGWLIHQPLMIGACTIGLATGITNLYYIFKPHPGPGEYLKEHLKGLVGCGISVYTAFFAFGAVRLFPQLALAPGFWAIPLVVGLGIILYHWHRLNQQFRGRTRTASLAT
jgi:hypothetical protein